MSERTVIIGSIENYIPGENFSEYRERLEQFFAVNKVKDDEKVSMFITMVGPETYSILKSLTDPKKPSEKTYTELVGFLEKFFLPKKNKRVERYKFFKMSQNDGEDISSFIIRLKSQAKTCEFGEYLNDALTDKLIIGLKDSRIQQELLKDDSKSFEENTTTALNLEMSSREAKLIHKPSYLPSIQVVKNKNSRKAIFVQQKNKPNSSELKKKLCSKCGKKVHPESRCPANKWTCFKCGKIGHTSVVCTDKAVAGNSKGRIGVVQGRSNSASSSIDTTPLNVCLEIEGKEVEMELDSGACSTIMDEVTFKKLFGEIDLIDDKKSFSVLNGKSVKCIGYASLRVRWGDVFHRLVVNVVKSPKFKPLLGRNWINVLWPNWRKNFEQVNSVSVLSNSISLVSNNDNILQEISLKFQNIVSNNSLPIKTHTADIVLEKNTTPIFHKAYSLPFKCRDAVEKELVRLVKHNVLEVVKYSRWASPIVVVPKANGSMRICIDCKVTVNKYVLTEHYPLPRIDEIFASLANCKFFCAIDLTGAYQQLLVSEMSKEYLTINTHKGLFRYTRLPYGLKSAPSIFQNVMDQILVGLKRVSCYLDDILIGGSTSDECKRNLFLVLSRLNEFNVKINLEKCLFLKQTVDYLGHTLSPEGIRPLQKKVEAIENAQPPKDLQQLQSFLGLLNYYSRFIPNLASRLSPLYNLLKKDTKFVWSENCQRAFDECKKLLQDNNLLEVYDPSKPIIVASDASPYGVGAVMSHVVNGVEKPVLFASSTLSPAEKNYSQLHREALAIVFAVKKFHKYIYGHCFVIFTDHQALKEVFHPHKSTPSVAAARLQRWSILLSMYDYSIEYKKGSLMSNADALSRLPSNESTGISEFKINSFNFSNSLPISTKKVALQTEKDEILKQVYNFEKTGWPSSSSKINFQNQKVMEYYKKKDYLSCEDNCLFYMNRIVIPDSMKRDVLKLLHEHHIGIVRMKMLARSYVWWLKIDKEIEDFVKECFICQQTQRVPKEVVTSKWSDPKFPFERVHIDFYDLNNVKYLIIVDSFSKFVDVEIMKSTTASKVIGILLRYFSIFGLPTTLVSDNGPPFNSHEFVNFLKQQNVKFVTIPPYHSASNGQAEKHVDIMKTYLKKYLLGYGQNMEKLKSNLQSLLFKLRNTPSMATNKKPSEVIFSYKPKTLLDIINKKPELSKTEIIKKSNEVSEMKKCNKNELKNKTETKDNKIIFKEGEKVMYRNHFKEFVKWIPSRILQSISPFTYLVNVNNHIRFVHVNSLKKSNLNDCHHPRKIVLTSQMKNWQVNSPVSFQARNLDLDNVDSPDVFSSPLGSPIESPKSEDISDISESSPLPVKSEPTKTEETPGTSRGIVKAPLDESPQPANNHRGSTPRRSKRVRGVPNRLRYHRK